MAMLTVTSESGREYSGFDIAAAVMTAQQAEDMAVELKRRGGGFTCVVEEGLRAKAAGWRREAEFIERLFADAEAREERGGDG